jgi:hypothetical protein
MEGPLKARLCRGAQDGSAVSRCAKAAASAIMTSVAGGWEAVAQLCLAATSEHPASCLRDAPGT